MGQLVFQVTEQELPLLQRNLETVCLKNRFGEITPFKLQVEGLLITFYFAENESQRLSLSWPVGCKTGPEDHSLSSSEIFAEEGKYPSFFLSTTTLGVNDPSTPYLLVEELARKGLYQLREQTYVWEQAQLALEPSYFQRLALLAERLALVLTGRKEGPTGQSLLEEIYAHVETLFETYACQAIGCRQQTQPKLPTLLGTFVTVPNATTTLMSAKAFNTLIVTESDTNEPKDEDPTAEHFSEKVSPFVDSVTKYQKQGFKVGREIPMGAYLREALKKDDLGESTPPSPLSKEQVQVQAQVILEKVDRIATVSSGLFHFWFLRLLELSFESMCGQNLCLTTLLEVCSLLKTKKPKLPIVLQLPPTSPHDDKPPNPFIVGAIDALSRSEMGDCGIGLTWTFETSKASTQATFFSVRDQLDYWSRWNWPILITFQQRANKDGDEICEKSLLLLLRYLLSRPEVSGIFFEPIVEPGEEASATLSPTIESLLQQFRSRYLL
ncbi:MAG: hypothetical protein MPJ24_11485 [Pirellulaceae bacterium]|nr:hypothetical protein [Pirellulaceae bacterium]